MELDISFWSQVEKDSICWDWIGTKNSYGYGVYPINKKPKGVHRLSYENTKGKIPEGLQIDHLCRNRHCVNPEHLEAVTNKENVLRGRGISAQNARKTHCIHGHEFTLENTSFFNGHHRRCKKCHVRINREYLDRKASQQ